MTKSWLPLEFWASPAQLSQVQQIWQRVELRSMLSVVRDNHGYQVYLVGGAVRDLLLGREIKDFDLLATCAAPDLVALIAELKRTAGVTVIPLDRTRGILRVCYQESEGVDVAALLEASVEEDLGRRDVTFNALALAPDGSLRDPFEGRQDLRRRLVRAVSGEALESDPLRVLRCFRLAAELSFDLEPTTREQVALSAPGLCRVAGERISVELQRLLAAADWPLMMEFQRAGIVEAIWEWSGQTVPWDLLAQWWPTASKGPERVLTTLAILLREAAREPQQRQECLARIKLSRQHSRELESCWAAWSVLEQSAPENLREIFALQEIAGNAQLERLLTIAVLPAFRRPLDPQSAQRIQAAISDGGELCAQALPIGGDELCRHWEREPGAWLGPVLAELRAAWACREMDSVEALLAHSADFLDRP